MGSPRRRTWNLLATPALSALVVLSITLLITMLFGATRGSSAQAPSKSTPGAAAKDASKTPKTSEPAAEPHTKAIEGFSQLRHEVLELISGATKRIWVATDYLTDGEIVSALYVARYRKLDVQVLLGRKKSRRYMSRLNYLKNQSIPVFLKPRAFHMDHASAVLADNRLLFIDGELNFLAKHRKFQLVYVQGNEVDRFTKAFAKAAGQKVAAVPKPIPLVGRPRSHQPSRSRLPKVKPRYNRNRAAKRSGVYTYDKSDNERPSYLPSQLPKGTIWEKRLQQSPTGTPLEERK